MFFEYIIIIKYLIIILGCSILLLFLSLLLVYQKPDVSKLSPYECGFNPYGDARMNFDVRYYLVAILFIIFDLELIFLYPWIFCIKLLNVWGFYCMFLFMFILTIGLIYELFTESLDWV